jgi:hypothetical protein
MPVTELLIDIVSSQQSGAFVLGNHALRSNWVNSFYFPPFACTGCGAREGITSNGRNSVRTWDSPEIAMVCDRTPSN